MDHAPTVLFQCRSSVNAKVNQMIYVRDDDVLLKRMAHTDAAGEFVNVHNIIEKYGYTHCPALLTNDLNEFPEVIEFIRYKTQQGKMIPQLHGSSHIDYAKLSVKEIQEDYRRCQDWFLSNIGVRFTKHYTPWGAGGRRKDGTPMVNGTHIAPTANAMGISVVDMYKPLDPRHILSDTETSFSKYDGRTIVIHWWFSPEILDQALAKLKEAENGTS